MPRYQFTGSWQKEVADGESPELHEELFEAPNDKAAIEKVEAFRNENRPVFNAKLARVEEVEVTIPDNLGYEFLPWKYCECGCKCSYVHIGATSYCLHMVIQNHEITDYHLDEGHGNWFGRLGHFKKFPDADRKVREIVGKSFPRELAAILKTAKALGIEPAIA